MAEISDLDRVFHPASVAVVGASSDMFSAGRMVLLEPLVDFGFKGNIYPVNPKDTEVMGFKCYQSVKDIPGPVDNVMVSVPARFTPQIVQDCATKGVKAVSFFTAGFSEIDASEGKELEDEIVRIAQAGGVRLVGPNCMGIYCPSGGLTFDSSFPKQSGSVSFLCQSGGNTIYGVQAAAARGLYFNKAISYGNACDINETELLEYFAQDPETKVIAAYIEGVKDGPRFAQVLRKATEAKPVVVLKGGQSPAGAATAASHTASLAGSEEVWKSLFKQAGAIQVCSIDEMIDAILPFVYMSVPEGRNVGVIGAGGGASVIAADDCASCGLVLPPIPEELKQELKTFTTPAGNIFQNPIDTQSFMLGPEQFSKTILTVANWHEIDMMILHIGHDVVMTEFGMTKQFVETVVSIAKNIDKSTAIVLDYINSIKGWEAVFDEQQRCWEAGLPVFRSMTGAASAIDMFLQYHEKYGNGAES